MQTWELSAREHIRDTLARYTWSGDAGRVAGLADAFCPDGVLEIRGEPPLHGRLLYALGSLLIYEPLKNMLGLSRVRIAYTAGEAIGPDLFSFYRSLGLNLKQLYGQTEAFLYLTAQRDGDIHADTVGRALPHVPHGLKPVHPPVLYAMDEMGLQPNPRYVKCARNVGAVMGK